MAVTPKIAIIGAGPAGLTLARLLHVASIPSTIFEADNATSHHPQGGTLDLHTDTGLAAIKTAGLWEAFHPHARYDGEAAIFADKHFTKHFEIAGSSEETSNGRPEIDRTKLREILLESLPKDAIKWGQKLRKVDDDLTLHFIDGSAETGFDLVVGADGAWSKVAALLSDTKPFYTGLGGLTMKVADARNRAPYLEKLVNKGSLFAFSDGKQIVSQFNGDGTVRIYTWFKAVEDWQKSCEYDMRDVGQVKQFLAKKFYDWAPELRQFTQVADPDDLVVRNLYMLPVGHHWEHRQGATLIGDSAHLMTPFAGEGVNVAMTDALVLSQSIIEGCKEGTKVLDRKIKEYEEEMFARGSVVTGLTKRNMDSIMSEEPAELWLPKMLSQTFGQGAGAEVNGSVENKT